MPEFNVGDRVRERHGNVAGKILSIGDTAQILTDDGVSRVQHDNVKAFIEITHGPGAGKPYGFMHYDLDELEHLD
ncbi:hypothetical protein [Gordonia sp. AC31]|uniref:hypothetical protein n=1 Tax=Gordonia sp. AC31 TaxID=2962571 RepID=UPI002882C906|nr:hypothetical protein [Gordonia sp. AC31]MDT0223447.1 hypothetical protein [Gordonia sp. AC31]